MRSRLAAGVLRRAGAVAGVAVALCGAAGCSSDKEAGRTDAVVGTITTPVASASPNTSPSTGSATLNGVVIIPDGSPVLCTRSGERLTVFVGEIGARNLASAVIEGDRLLRATVTDPEDVATVAQGKGSGTVTRAGDQYAVRAEALGVRKQAQPAGEIPMTFELHFACP